MTVEEGRLIVPGSTSRSQIMLFLCGGEQNQAAFVLGLAYPGTSKVLGFVFLFCFWR